MATLDLVVPLHSGAVCYEKTTKTRKKQKNSLERETDIFYFKKIKSRETVRKTSPINSKRNKAFSGHGKKAPLVMHALSKYLEVGVENTRTCPKLT